MQLSSYVALSGQLALDRRMVALAQNIANAGTAGYRADIIEFKSILAQTGESQTAFAAAGGQFVNTEAGGINQTKNPLDLAIKGNGFFAFQSPNGTYYSRDGRLSLTTDGNLVNAAGDAMLDSGGGAIQLDPKNPDISIGANGSVSQSGANKGTIGIYELDLDKGFRRSGPSGFVPSVEPSSVKGSNEDSVLQGYYEESNVNTVRAMTTLIEISRAFEAVSNLNDRASEAQKSAIEILGSRS